MNLSDLRTAMRDSLGTPTNTADDARFNRLINQTYHRILTMKGIGPRLRRGLLTFTTTANVPLGALPQAVTKIHSVTDRTNDRVLTEIALGEIRTMDPGLRSSSVTPQSYAIYNLGDAVAKDPTALGTLQVASSSAGDNGVNAVAYVEGVRSDGNYFSSSVQLNGLSPVNIGPNSTVNVRKFYLKTVCSGDVGLIDAVAVPLGSIIVGKKYARYSRIHLYPTPSSVFTLYIDADIHIEDMVNDTDEPILPEDFHISLVHGSLAREYAGKRDKITQFQIEKSEFVQIVADMRSYIQTGPLSTVERSPRFSQLGPFFPAGS